MFFYHFAKNVVWSILKILFRVEVKGKENIPDEGPVIICSNHISNFDPPLVAGSSSRPIHFLAKEELFKKKWLNLILRKVQAFPIKRGMKDRQALRTALKILSENHVLGLFPEGTRSKTGEIGEGLSGVGFFALRSEAQVVPCAIIGPYRIGKTLKIVYGQPIDMGNLRAEKASAKDATVEIMQSIKELKKKHA